VIYGRLGGIPSFGIDLDGKVLAEKSIDIELRVRETIVGDWGISKRSRSFCRVQTDFTKLRNWVCAYPLHNASSHGDNSRTQRGSLCNPPQPLSLCPAQGQKDQYAHIAEPECGSVVRPYSLAKNAQ
jgi:hypothetical protein